MKSGEYVLILIVLIVTFKVLIEYLCQVILNQLVAGIAKSSSRLQVNLPKPLKIDLWSFLYQSLNFRQTNDLAVKLIIPHLTVFLTIDKDIKTQSPLEDKMNINLESIFPEFADIRNIQHPFWVIVIPWMLFLRSFVSFVHLGFINIEYFKFIVQDNQKQILQSIENIDLKCHAIFKKQTSEFFLQFDFGKQQPAILSTENQNELISLSQCNISIVVIWPEKSNIQNLKPPLPHSMKILCDSIETIISKEFSSLMVLYDTFLPQWNENINILFPTFFFFTIRKFTLSINSTKEQYKFGLDVYEFDFKAIKNKYKTWDLNITSNRFIFLLIITQENTSLRILNELLSGNEFNVKLLINPIEKLILDPMNFQINQIIIDIQSINDQIKIEFFSYFSDILFNLLKQTFTFSLKLFIPSLFILFLQDNKLISLEFNQVNILLEDYEKKLIKEKKSFIISNSLLKENLSFYNFQCHRIIGHFDKDFFISLDKVRFIYSEKKENLISSLSDLFIESLQVKWNLECLFFGYFFIYILNYFQKFTINKETNTKSTFYYSNELLLNVNIPCTKVTFPYTLNEDSLNEYATFDDLNILLFNESELHWKLNFHNLKCSSSSDFLVEVYFLMNHFTLEETKIIKNNEIHYIMEIYGLNIIYCFTTYLQLRLYKLLQDFMMSLVLMNCKHQNTFLVKNLIEQKRLCRVLLEKVKIETYYKNQFTLSIELESIEKMSRKYNFQLIRIKFLDNLLLSIKQLNINYTEKSEFIQLQTEELNKNDAVIDADGILTSISSNCLKYLDKDFSIIQNKAIAFLQSIRKLDKLSKTLQLSHFAILSGEKFRLNFKFTNIMVELVKDPFEAWLEEVYPFWMDEITLRTVRERLLLEKFNRVLSDEADSLLQEENSNIYIQKMKHFHEKLSKISNSLVRFDVKELFMNFSNISSITWIKEKIEELDEVSLASFGSPLYRTLNGFFFSIKLNQVTISLCESAVPLLNAESKFTGSIIFAQTESTQEFIVKKNIVLSETIKEEVIQYLVPTKIFFLIDGEIASSIISYSPAYISVFKDIKTVLDNLKLQLFSYPFEEFSSCDVLRWILHGRFAIKIKNTSVRLFLSNQLTDTGSYLLLQMNSTTLNYSSERFQFDIVHLECRHEPNGSENILDISNILITFDLLWSCRGDSKNHYLYPVCFSTCSNDRNALFIYPSSNTRSYSFISESLTNFKNYSSQQLSLKISIINNSFCIQENNNFQINLSNTSIVVLKEWLNYYFFISFLPSKSSHSFHRNCICKILSEVEIHGKLQTINLLLHNNMENQVALKVFVNEMTEFSLAFIRSRKPVLNKVKPFFSLLEYPFWLQSNMNICIKSTESRLYSANTNIEGFYLAIIDKIQYQDQISPTNLQEIKINSDSISLISIEGCRLLVTSDSLSLLLDLFDDFQDLLLDFVLVLLFQKKLDAMMAIKHPLSSVSSNDTETVINSQSLYSINCRSCQFQFQEESVKSVIIATLDSLNAIGNQNLVTKALKSIIRVEHVQLFMGLLKEDSSFNSFWLSKTSNQEARKDLCHRIVSPIQGSLQVFIEKGHPSLAIDFQYEIPTVSIDINWMQSFYIFNILETIFNCILHKIMEKRLQTYTWKLKAQLITNEKLIQDIKSLRLKEQNLQWNINHLNTIKENAYLTPSRATIEQITLYKEEYTGITDELRILLAEQRRRQFNPSIELSLTIGHICLSFHEDETHRDLFEFNISRFEFKRSKVEPKDVFNLFIESFTCNNLQPAAFYPITLMPCVSSYDSWFQGQHMLKIQLQLSFSEKNLLTLLKFKLEPLQLSITEEMLLNFVKNISASKTKLTFECKRIKDSREKRFNFSDEREAKKLFQFERQNVKRQILLKEFEIQEIKILLNCKAKIGSHLEDIKRFPLKVQSLMYKDAICSSSDLFVRVYNDLRAELLPQIDAAFPFFARFLNDLGNEIEHQRLQKS